jgi:RNA polymerase sigma-70 factor (ECF subfamily)
MTGQTSTLMALRDPDIRLMLRVRADDQAAFAELVEKYQRRLVGVLVHLIGHPQEAEDLAQEVFLRVYRSRHKYSPKAKFSTWLFTIANNLALNARRDRHKRQAAPLGGTESNEFTIRPPDPSAPPPAQRLDQQELAAVVRRALDDLSDRHRMAVVLNKFEDMGYAEIAEVMGVGEKAVKSLLSRARGKLREALRPYIDMDGVVPDDGPPDDE